MQLPRLDAIAQAAFNAQQLPSLVVSADETIVLANRAADRLFAIHIEDTSEKHDLVGTSVSDLSISGHKSKKKFDRIFKELLEDEVAAARADTLGDEGSSDDGFWQEHENRGSQGQTVDILRTSSKAVTSARVRLQKLDIALVAYYLLSFSKPIQLLDQPMLWPYINTHDTHIPSTISIADDPAVSLPCSRTLSRTPSYSTSTAGSLDARFARLREAVDYHTSDISGFLFSADEKFAVPNFCGPDKVQPVEIEDVQQFCSQWDIWDDHFVARLPIEEWPCLRLNRERQDFRGVRVGEIQASGVKRITECTGKCLYDQQTGEYLGGVVYFRHLGEYAQVMAQEKEGRLASYETICDSMPHIMFAGRGGECDYFNKGWYDFTGLTKEGSVGEGWKNAVHEKDLPGLIDKFAQGAGEEGDFFSHECRYRRHDGVYLWMTLRLKSLKDSTGALLKWYGSITDIDDDVRMRKEAADIQKHMSNILAHASVTVFRVDSNYKTLSVGGEGGIGAHSERWRQRLGTNAIDSLHALQEGGVPEFASKMVEAMQGNVEFTTSEDHIRDRVVKTRFMPDIDNSSGSPVVKGVIGCSIDITELHQRSNLEMENARLIAEQQMAQESSRLKSQFLAHMSHEVRTPLAGVIGMSDLLAEKKLDSAERDLVDCIQISAHNLLAIVNDILDFSKIEANEMHLENIRFDLAALIQECGRLFVHSTQQKSVDFCYSVDIAKDMMLMGDPSRIRQILSNLLSNAAKFTTEGSVKLSVTLAGNMAEIIVEDTGCGMDKATQERIFEPFRQGDSSTARLHGGTGLGLVISRNLAQMMGGKLELESSPGVGTKAKFILPLVYSNRPQLSRHSTYTVQSDSDDAVFSIDKNVLIVEDNPINQKIALHSVKKLGYKGIAVSNGKEALDYLLENLEVDVILMDVQMPVLDGYQTTRILKSQAQYQHLKDIPIIALTASAIKGDNEKCAAAGMDDYLSKPYPLKKLKDKLSKWASKRG